MKQINLLPKPTFIEQYKRFFVFAIGFALCVVIALFELLRFLNRENPIPPSFASPFSSVINTSFSRHSIDKLQVVGYLCDADKVASNSCWCLVKAPDGEVSTLKMGDFVGYEKAEVVDIKRKGIYLNVPQKKDLVLIRRAVSKDQ